MLNELYQSLDPIAFTIGPFTARWYGLAYVAGFLCAIAIMYVVGKRWKTRFDFDSLCIVLLCAMIGVIVGGRLGYVLFYNFEMYAADPLSILNFSRGGMSFHGGFVGALIAGIVASRIIKMPFLSLVDLAMIGVPLGLLFGRCANFINGELWGAPTDLPWGVVFGGAAGTEPRHPSQLYEAFFEGIVLFIVLFVLSRKQPPFPQGTYSGVFMLGYGICRFMVEFIREPDVQLGYLWGGWLTMGQVLSLPLILAGIALLIYAWKTKKPQDGPHYNEAN
ncbi:MAG: prolipoprotein diacylglyceryl transferase [Eggerthellaceae bacterium]|jgi:phosphatidylglycerol:prolipoprotein diacylglycerol transferase|nr:prolipoprotein diacylglyceryl transferase [Eggerthellaceae bacterium]